MEEGLPHKAANLNADRVHEGHHVLLLLAGRQAHRIYSIHAVLKTNQPAPKTNLQLPAGC